MTMTMVRVSLSLSLSLSWAKQRATNGMYACHHTEQSFAFDFELPMPTQPDPGPDADRQASQAPPLVEASDQAGLADF
jgi:hypothetical protein